MLLMTANSKNTNHFKLRSPKIVNKSWFFSNLFYRFWFFILRFLQAGRSFQNDYSLALVNNSKAPLEIDDKPLSSLKTEKSNSKSDSFSFSNSSIDNNVSENQFALIVGTYQEKYNAVILEKEMKKEVLNIVA